jgi:hypothetical protein
MTRPPDLAGRRYAPLVAVVFIVVALLANRALLPGSNGAPTGPSALPSRSPLPGSSGGPASPAAPTVVRPVVVVPAGIDPTASSDVTPILQAVVDRAPAGATIRFPAGARYLLAGTLRLDGRQDLVIDGMGGSLLAVPGTGAARPIIGIAGSSRLMIRDLSLVGVNAQAGVYQPAREHDHGIAIVGGSAITLSGLTIERTSGDCVYVADRNGTWSDGVSLLDRSCSGPGRNGVAVVGGRNVEVERTAFSNVGYHVLDLEPNQGPPLEGAANVTFRANTVRAPVARYVIAANGWGPVDHLTVADNDLVGLALRITVAPEAGSGFRRSSVQITGNRSDTTAEQAEPLMQFDSTDDLTVTGNIQPLAPATVLAAITNSCRVAISGNQIGPGQQSAVSVPSC